MSQSELRLHWRINPATSCWHAVRAMLRRRTLRNAEWTAALSEPVAKLAQALAEERIPGEAFLDHVLALSATLDTSQRCIEVALAKTIGQGEGAFRLRRMAALAEHLRERFAQAVSSPLPPLRSALEDLRRRWNLHSLSLLGGIRNWTDAEVLVEEATLVVVHPVVGGAGSPHLWYNLACVEGVTPDPFAELPETLRLAWLVATLNIDVPQFSENLARSRVALIAQLAMVPVVLVAAETWELAACDETTIRKAAAAWLGPPEGGEPNANLVLQWWDVYRTMRPPWPAALQALDRMLAETESASDVTRN